MIIKENSRVMTVVQIKPAFGVLEKHTCCIESPTSRGCMPPEDPATLQGDIDGDGRSLIPVLITLVAYL